ncbi:mitochondrial intermediate peptidase [Sistotremastrum niveocremeum HHB9708]|uniref:Mitochondrial intermediate peptidase n=1 Tax=Sistotremastrum niveocremeum HHB9708 TaxID=1314777 RepID=A0A164UQL3_9AGAM|nr:mitochondrial intermediate peptidase [Sistotremastrum niveocremeum HHB9708]
MLISLKQLGRCTRAQNVARSIKWSRRRLSGTTSRRAALLDDDLITLFDSPSRKPSTSIQARGLFLDDRITHPGMFQRLVDDTLVRADLLLRRILSAEHSRPELFQVVKNLDRLSDLLCGVIDLAEFVRNAHPDEEWVYHANSAYESLCEFMNTLNTHEGLDKVLDIVLGDTTVTSQLSTEALKTAHIFSADFARSGRNLPPHQRGRFVTLSSEILTLGRAFLNEASAPRPPISIPASQLQGFKSHTNRFSGKSLTIYPGSVQAHDIMKSSTNESLRRRLYVAARSSSVAQVEILERLLRARAEMAKLVGFDSFASMTLDDKMAKSPDNVTNFLSVLATHNRPYALNDIEKIRQRKHTVLGNSQSHDIHPWDRDIYLPPQSPESPIIMPPLTVGRVFRALSRLFTKIYGISFRPVNVSLGEVWHDDVQKLEVVDEAEGVIGWIYTDLFSRSGKPNGAAHYTVRCSRRLDEDNLSNDLPITTDSSRTLRPPDVAHRIRGHDGLWQLPIVVLMCEFSRSSLNHGQAILDWQEVSTLCHEMGHAMHSMIGRTEYHNVSGTRCATDFVELPSILMEHFLTSPTVLALFHDSEPDLPSSSINSAHPQQNVSALDTHDQIMLASLDQEYHSRAALEPGFDSTAVLAALTDRQGVWPYVQGTSWQTQFGHLFSYGATYYSYLFDRAIASQVWSTLFQNNPLDREKGEKFKREVLKWGGGKDPWEMVSAVLDDPRLASGDAQAMRQIGQWRIAYDVSSAGTHL